MATQVQMEMVDQLEQVEIFQERLLRATLGMGDRLGYYQALAGNGGLTLVELAEKTGTNVRYTRERLVQQTVPGILQLLNEEDGAERRIFRLPAAYAEVLTEADRLNFLAPLAQITVGAFYPLEEIISAYRNGSGVPFENYGHDRREDRPG